MQSHNTPTPQFKTCSVCKRRLSSDLFYRRKTAKDGLRSDCKECGLRATKEHYRNNQQVMAARARSRYRDDPEKAKAAQRRYRDANREVIAERDRIARSKNKERISEYNRQYLEKNREKINARKARYREENREVLNERQRRYREKNREQVLERNRRLYRENPDLYRSYNRNRLARRRANGGYVTVAEWHAILDKFGGKCAKCGESENIHMDHVVPLSRGGRHAVDNIQPLCGPCNSRKHAKTEDYRGKMYRPLALPIDKEN